MAKKGEISCSEWYDTYVLLQKTKPGSDQQKNSKSATFENIEDILHEYDISVLKEPESQELLKKWTLEKTRIEKFLSSRL